MYTQPDSGRHHTEVLEIQSKDGKNAGQQQKRRMRYSSSIHNLTVESAVRV